MPDGRLHDVPLERKLTALRDPACYPGTAMEVAAIETHMSWVFLAGDEAYKLKKPVRHGRLDFRTASARHFYCLEELRLNRRLAPEVYLGVVPLVLLENGTIRLGGRDGEPVDWLVRMRRLPADRMLDALLARGAATPGDMRRIARRLCSFYAAQPPAAVTAAAYRALLSREIDESEHELCNVEWPLPQARVREACRRLRLVLGRRAAMFDERVASGRVVEGHGDLRPEHVYLGDGIAVIDCLEFSAELRTLDSADEVGFLALECERAGAAGLAHELISAYTAASGDSPPPGLVHFHQASRALTRARLAIAHLHEPRFREGSVAGHYVKRARGYLALALRHLRAGGRIASP